MIQEQQEWETKKKMTKRKLFLIIADVALLALCIVQCALSTRDSAKVFNFRDTPDEITIVGQKENVNLVCENDQWFVGEQKYPVNQSFVDSIIESISSIRTLDKVGTANSDADIARYELNEGKNLCVTALKNGKVLRSVVVGKDSTASSQGYITIDGGKDIYLASGNLKITFDKSVDDLRSRVIWTVEKEDITSVKISPVGGQPWTVMKMGSGDDVVWNISGATCDLDTAKVSAWVNGMASVSTPVWHESGENLGGEKILTATITAALKEITIDIYSSTSEDDKTLYWATCSETPYTFELAQYAVQKFQKNVDELSK